MTEFWSGIIGAVVGGSFAIIGGFIGNNHQIKKQLRIEQQNLIFDLLRHLRQIGICGKRINDFEENLRLCSENEKQQVIENIQKNYDKLTNEVLEFESKRNRITLREYAPFKILADQLDTRDTINGKNLVEISSKLKILIEKKFHRRKATK